MSGNEQKAADSPGNLRVAGRIARGFIDSKLTPLVILAALLLAALQHPANAARGRTADRRAHA